MSGSQKRHTAPEIGKHTRRHHFGGSHLCLVFKRFNSHRMNLYEERLFSVNGWFSSSLRPWYRNIQLIQLKFLVLSNLFFLSESFVS